MYMLIHRTADVRAGRVNSMVISCHCDECCFAGLSLLQFGTVMNRVNYQNLFCKLFTCILADYITVDLLYIVLHDQSRFCNLIMYYCA